MSATEKSCLYHRCMNECISQAAAAGTTYCSVSDVVAAAAAPTQTHTHAAQFCLKLDLLLQLIHNHYSNNFSPRENSMCALASAYQRTKLMAPLYHLHTQHARSRQQLHYYSQAGGERERARERAIK